MKKVAFISGSSRGIGRAIALNLSREGFTVFVNGRTESTVAKVVSDIQSAGGTAYPIICDLTQDRAAGDAILKVQQTAGQLDLLVLNLGSGRTPNDWNPSLEETRRIFDLNFFSAVALAQSALEIMKSGSNVVFISSIAGCEALGAPIAYSAAKAALLTYSKTLSMKAAARGIRVNTVSPGNVLFEGSTWDDKLKKDEPSVRKYIQEEVPLNNFATPDDIAAAVSFLASAPFITGHNLIVDGGQTTKLI